MDISFGLYLKKVYHKFICFGYAKCFILYFLQLAQFCTPWKWRPGQVPTPLPPSYATAFNLAK